MWNRKSAFTEIRKVKGIKVKGIGGQYVEAKGIGTVKFKLEDDSGKKHTVKIPNTLFVPDMPISLLCPQHWSQQTKDHYPVRNGTWCAILPDQCILHWDQRQFKRTVKYDEASNTPRFRTASGSELYRAFVAPLDHELNSESTEKVCFFASSTRPKRACCHDAQVISDDEGGEEDEEDELQAKAIFEPVKRDAEDLPQVSDKEHHFEQTIDEQTMDFTQNKTVPQPTVIEDDEAQVSATTDLAELIRWHYRLGHLSYNKIKLLALLGIIPRRLARIKPPKCAGCIFGAMTKRPWRTKGKNKGKVRVAKAAGDVVSVDQLQSTTPGFLAQMKGSLTKRRYTAATIFVDHFSGLSYVHLQKQLTSAETVEGKQAFEAYARDRGVRIKHYHADNG